MVVAGAERILHDVVLLIRVLIQHYRDRNKKVRSAKSVGSCFVDLLEARFGTS